MRYIATGRVHPERAGVSFGRMTFAAAEGGGVVAHCDSSQLTVVLDLPKIDGWLAAQITAADVGSMIVSALGFALGSGYTVEVIQVTEEDGTPHVFGVRPETLEFNPSEPVLSRALQVAAQNVFFRLALRDYVRAMTDTTDCATYCYRAIESIKAAIASETGEDSWDSMHTTLGTDRTIIEQCVKRFADPVRHGNWVAAPSTNAATRLEMLRCTKDILAKYLDRARPAA